MVAEAEAQNAIGDRYDEIEAPMEHGTRDEEEGKYFVSQCDLLNTEIKWEKLLPHYNKARLNEWTDPAWTVRGRRVGGDDIQGDLPPSPAAESTSRAKTEGRGQKKMCVIVRRNRRSPGAGLYALTVPVSYAPAAAAFALRPPRWCVTAVKATVRPSSPFCYAPARLLMAVPSSSSSSSAAVIQFFSSFSLTPSPLTYARTQI